jgi:hypothetical protein
MSEVMLNLLDTRGARHGRMHGGLLESMVAALGAEPETIAELEAALARFHKPAGERGALSHFREGEREESWDAGCVVIDLPARVAAWDSTYGAFLRDGEVAYHDGEAATDIWIPYQTPDDWLVVEPLQDWRALAARRRAQRAAATFDARAVLYGAVADFLAREYSASATQDEREDDAAIHARWLTTPRADLQGATPRQCLLARRNFLDLDLQWRGVQWASTGECPPGLSPEAHAYRFGGFGTHENVLYYGLIRHLLAVCRDSAPESSAEELVALLRAEQHRWLHAEQPDLHGFSPYLMIEYERARLPFTVPSKEVFDEDDCPVCEEMRELSGPCFWHLDGAHLDNEFVFSFHPVREEWEAEQRSWQEMSEEFGD